jgi:gas vesicle protein
MTDQKKQENVSISPAAAAVTGAVVGAGIALAGAAMLKDEKNRKKVKDVLSNVKSHAVDYMENIQKSADDKKGEIQDKLEDGKKEIKHIASTASDDMRHSATR